MSLTQAEKITLCTCRKEDPCSRRCRERIDAVERILAARPLPLHRTEAGYPRCATCDGGGCPDCTDPA